MLAGAILAGDAAGTIDPFAGEGMSMALRSGELAAEEILRALDGGGDALALERYGRRWKAEFSRRIALCRRLGWLAVRPAFQAPMLALLRSLPPLGRALARSTRTGAWLEQG